MLRLAMVVLMIFMLLLQQATYTTAVNYCTQGSDLNNTCCFGDIIISPNATEIIDNAFDNCIGLTGVDFSQATSLTRIGNSAFFKCNHVTGDLAIPDSVTYIGEGAFADCFSLNGNLILGDGLQYIGLGAFSACISLTGDNAFTSCNSLNGNLTLGDGLQYIGLAAFQNCISLSGSLIIPASVTVIGASAFQYDSNFTCINVLGNPSIGQDAFDGTVGLNDTVCPANQPDNGGGGGNKPPSSPQTPPLKLLIVLGASIGGSALLISAIVIGMRIRYVKLTGLQYQNRYQVTKDDDDSIKRINNRSDV